MAAAAHHVGSAEHNVVALRCCLLRGLDRGREFRETAAARSKPAPLIGACIIVRQQWDAVCNRRPRHPLDRGRNLAGTAAHALGQAEEGLAGEPGPLDHWAELLWPQGSLVREQHMIVESE